MAKAVLSVKALTLTVYHDTRVDNTDGDMDVDPSGPEARAKQLEQQKLRRDCRDFTLPLQFTCPNGLAVVSGGVFAILANAVPNLRELNLCGCCWDAAIPSFGLACPHLIQLDFEALSVPVEALMNLPANLPNLTSLGIMNYDAGAADQPQLAAYLDAFLPTTQQCARLANLDIELGEYPSLTCQPDTWALIPTGLQHLCCACYMAESPSFNTLIRRVPSLCLRK
ncbi:MAG: hypothetical protein WDW38_007435 [Sanguina aurantia]